MTIRSTDFRVAEGEEVDLGKRPTRVEPVYVPKSDYKKQLKHHVHDLSEKQQLLYASNSHACC